MTAIRCACGRALRAIFERVRAAAPKLDSWTITCTRCGNHYQVTQEATKFRLKLLPSGGLAVSVADWLWDDPKIRTTLEELERLQDKKKLRKR